MRSSRTRPSAIATNRFAFELVSPASLEIMVDQGYLFELLSTPFGIARPYTNRATRALIGRMDGHLRAWIDEQLS